MINSVKLNYLHEVKTDYLKVLGILFMFIDHLGYLINNDIFRLIGRFSLPIFVYLLVLGNNRTSNKRNYLLRLLLFALFSQIPYSLLFDTLRLNIFFTLTLGLILINLEFDNYIKSFVFQFLFLVLSTVLNFYLPFDYGIYGLFLFLIFRWFNDKKINFIMFLLVTFLYSFIFNLTLQYYSILILPLIYSFSALESNFDLKLRLNKYLFYSFYPLHLLVLYLIFVF